MSRDVNQAPRQLRSFCPRGEGKRIVRIASASLGKRFLASLAQPRWICRHTPSEDEYQFPQQATVVYFPRNTES